MTDHDLTFYRLQACPFCERVARTLDELDVPHRSRFVEPLHSRRDVVKRLVGARTVPVVVDEATGVTMAESDRIVAYLERTYGDGGGGGGGDGDGDGVAGDDEVAGAGAATDGGR